jgi:hypothetical protein
MLQTAVKWRRPDLEREAAPTYKRRPLLRQPQEKTAATIEEAGSIADTMRRLHLHILQTATKKEDGAE